MNAVEQRKHFDEVIGRLDRLLSEFLLLPKIRPQATLDEADWQTLKHHADDLIGVGKAMLEQVNNK